MSLVRFTPFQALEEMREQLSNAYNEDSANYCSSSSLYMPIEIVESEKSFIIRSIVPGSRAEDITITSENGYITIEAKALRQELSETEKLHLSEFCYGSFHRTIKIGQNIVSDEISAALNDGILTVTIPKSSKAIKRVIKVNETNNTQSNQEEKAEQAEHSTN